MRLKDIFFFCAGILFLALAKTKNILRGYTSPKPFYITNTRESIAYDIQVVEAWLSYLDKYTRQSKNLLEGKTILELGPGSDLGTGLYLLAKGGENYIACDVHDLVKSVPDLFYDQLLETISHMEIQEKISVLRNQLDLFKAGIPSRLHYVVQKDFNLVSAIGRSTVDIVFSQAAFEHFDDFAATAKQLSAVSRPGTFLVAQIDLKTHSRWIRDKDANSIYRYSDRLYNLFHFRGIPNRVRPCQYKAVLQQSGWTDIQITPLKKMATQGAQTPKLNSKFLAIENQMTYLSIMITARKP